MNQARDFLAKSREYLTQSDLHQASEKGWGAAGHTVTVRRMRPVTNPSGRPVLPSL